MFRAFDEVDYLRDEWLNLLVDEGNVMELLSTLDL